MNDEAQGLEHLESVLDQWLAHRDFAAIARHLADWSPTEVATLLGDLEGDEAAAVIDLLPEAVVSEAFPFLPMEQQVGLVDAWSHSKQTVPRLTRLLNDLPPDDRTDLLQSLDGEVTQRMLALLSPEERKVAVQLLGYPEDSVGRLMTPDYVAIQSGWNASQALSHVRRYGKSSETIGVVYVVDRKWRLLDDLRIHELLLAEPDTPVADLMDERFIALHASDDQELAVQTFRENDRVALPVTDAGGVLIGIVTIDDMLDVAQEEATEDMQKIGGLEALDMPYIDTPFGTLIQKRARWLVVLFIGEMFTATALGFFEVEIGKAQVLAILMPLIIASGGNSGSQAASLMIRALAVGEVGLRDWWTVMRREILSGLTLGLILGTVGMLRIGLWQAATHQYGPHWALIAITVGLSLIGVVLWGTLTGSMLPFILRRLGQDPATSSAPFVATLVDVVGLVIYFLIARWILSGTLL